MLLNWGPLDGCLITSRSNVKLDMSVYHVEGNVGSAGNSQRMASPNIKSPGCQHPIWGIRAFQNGCAMMDYTFLVM